MRRQTGEQLRLFSYFRRKESVPSFPASRTQPCHLLSQELFLQLNFTPHSKDKGISASCVRIQDPSDCDLQHVIWASAAHLTPTQQTQGRLSGQPGDSLMKPYSPAQSAGTLFESPGCPLHARSCVFEQLCSWSCRAVWSDSSPLCVSSSQGYGKPVGSGLCS